MWDHGDGTAFAFYNPDYFWLAFFDKPVAYFNCVILFLEQGFSLLSRNYFMWQIALLSELYDL